MSKIYFEKTKKYKLLEYKAREKERFLNELESTNQKMVSLMNDNNISYFIVNACSELLGAITIEKQYNNPNLVVYIELFNDFLTNHNNKDVSYIIASLIDYISRIFYEKRKIIMRTSQEINLNNMDCKKRITLGYYEYVFDNTKYHCILSKLINELELTQSNLYDWNTYWQEKIYDENGTVLNNPNNDLLDPKTKMCLFPSLGLIGITTKAGVRNIYFNSDGTIKYQKISHKKLNKFQYTFNCDIIHDQFDFSFKKLNDDDKENLETSVSLDQQTFTLANNLVSYNLVKKSNNISQIMVNSMNMTYFLNLNGNIINQAFIQFKTYKSNGKINGVYQLKLNRNLPGIELWHISRKGKKHDLIPFLQEVDSYLGTDLMKLQFRVEDFNNLIKRLIAVCNKFALEHNYKQIINSDINDVTEILALEEKTKTIIKGIDEVPIPALQKMVRSFTSDEPQKSIHQTRSRGKKRQEQINVI